MAGAIDLDQTKVLEMAFKKVKEQAFYMKHAMVRPRIYIVQIAGGGT